ncbi:MAG: ATP-dependent Clp protease ATP-binding subunit [Candidatus Dojkabacteria bacterium]|jgi:ATP-dependent Clp protease ATP-binding subunit ClpA
MALDLETNKKTIIGYHQKDESKFGIIEKSFPIFENDGESVFILTRDHFFSISTSQIKALLKNFLRYKKFSDIKRTIANILLIPGLFISFLLLLKYASFLDSSPRILEILDMGFVNSLFGISIISIILLWHDFYENKSHPIKLPKLLPIQQKEIDEIKSSGFKFGRYSHLETINFLTEETLELLCLFTEEDTFKTLNFYNNLLQNNYDVRQIIRRTGVDITVESIKGAGITEENVKDYPVNSLRSILTYALQEALLTESHEIQPQHLFLAITKIFPAIEKYLRQNALSIEMLREVCIYNNELINRRQRTKYLDPNINYYRKGGVMRNWIYGYTFVLSHFSEDLNEKVSVSKDIFGIGHDEEVDALVASLGKLTNRNALLVGEPGVGKSSLILGLAQRINSGNVPEQLEKKRILELNLNGLIAFSKKQKNLEEIVMKTFSELEKAGNTILYVDDIQELIPTKAQESGHSIAAMLMPYIINSKFPIVGTTNYADYKRYFYTSESLRQSFTNIEVKEVSPKDTLVILESKIPSLEKNFNCFITFPALFASVEFSQRYIRERKLPSSAVQTIEAACAWAQSSDIKILTAEHISKYISLQKNINVTTIDQEESNKLLKLEENIKNKVIGQEEAVIAIAEALRRARVDIRNPEKPIGVFLFVGPTGVGKTHLAKVVGEEYFGGKDTIVRIDMSEYQEIQSIQRFLGSSSLEFGQTAITLLDRVKRNPHTVVLFDEIEKAHPNMLDLFLQLFDEGRLTDTNGETVDFTNCIIICTSNIGSKMLLDTLDKKQLLWEEAENRVLLEIRQVLKPELINRFDKLIVFTPHDLKNLTEIAGLLLEELKMRLAKKDILIKWSDQIPMLIANKTNEPAMGARPMKRYIQDKIEGQLAKGIIEQQINPGEEIDIKESWIQ